MIPVGTLCYLVRAVEPADVGSVVVVMAHGGCGKDETSRWLPCDEFTQTGYCSSVCQAENSEAQWCIDEWSELRPIAGPDVDVEVSRELETV